MTVDRLFTPPAHNESAAHAEQARELLSLATDAGNLSTWTSNSLGQLDYENGFDALRDALAGQGQATLAVHAELARIAAALEMIAKTPAAIQHLTDHVAAAGRAVQDRLADVSGEIRDLCATVDQGVEFADTTAAAAGSLVVGVHGLTDAVDCLSRPRPRWWQWRIRIALRKLGQQQAFMPDVAAPMRPGATALAAPPEGF